MCLIKYFKYVFIFNKDGSEIKMLVSIFFTHFLIQFSLEADEGIETGAGLVPGLPTTKPSNVTPGNNSWKVGNAHFCKTLISSPFCTFLLFM